MKKTVLFIAIIALAASCKPKTNDYIAAGMYFRSMDSIKQYNSDSLADHNAKLLAKWQTRAAEIQAHRDSAAAYNFKHR